MSDGHALAVTHREMRVRRRSMKNRILVFTAILLAPLAQVNAAAPPHTVRDVYAPVWVGRPPSDAISGLVRLETGELRHYDYGFDPTPTIHHHPDFLATSYIFSRDQGLTWASKAVPPGHLGADMRSPVSGEYLRLQTKSGRRLRHQDQGRDRRHVDDASSVGDIDLRRGTKSHAIRGVHSQRPRALAPWSTMRRFKPDYRYQVGTLYSDDDGETWQHSNLIEAPPHEPNERDKSVRWQNGATEPTVVELRDGRIWMIIRTSLDYHYQAYSSDGGTTWGRPEPSPFYGTLTDPTIGRLKDGRLLFLWNNTLPLPEFPKNEFTAPFITQSASDGSGEDMFNNRDASTARSLLTMARRGAAFERSCWIPTATTHATPRPVAWTAAYTNRSLWKWRLVGSSYRSANIGCIGRCLSSIPIGCWKPSAPTILPTASMIGRCMATSKAYAVTALNRFESSTLIPCPDDAKRRVLRVCNIGRKDAIFPRGGATWNFPAGQAGFVEARLRRK